MRELFEGKAIHPGTIMKYTLMMDPVTLKLVTPTNTPHKTALLRQEKLPSINAFIEAQKINGKRVQCSIHVYNNQTFVTVRNFTDNKLELYRF